MSDDQQSGLRAFQTSGDTGALLRFVRESGRDEQAYAAALRAMAGVFDPLSVGLWPVFGDLDTAALREHIEAVRQIVEWMAQSDRADLRDAAAEMKALLARKAAP